MRKIQDKEICNFELLCDIFHNDRAKGATSKTAKERLRQLSEHEITIDDVDQLQEENVVVLDNFENLTGVGNVGSSSNKTVKKPSKLGVKRKFEEVNSNANDEGLKVFTSSLTDIARQLAIANENFKKSNYRVYSSEEIYGELQKFGITDDVILDAADILMSDNKKAASFFGCPDELKLRWLQRHGFNMDD